MEQVNSRLLKQSSSVLKLPSHNNNYRQAHTQASSPKRIYFNQQRTSGNNSPSKKQSSQKLVLPSVTFRQPRNFAKEQQAQTKRAISQLRNAQNILNKESSPQMIYQQLVTYQHLPMKMPFLITIESLIKQLQLCLRSQPYRYRRGTIECANFIVRACIAVPEIPLLKIGLKLLGALYFYFGEVKYCISSYEKLRDVAEDDMDYNTVMFAYKQMGLCYQRVKDYQRALVCFKLMMYKSWLYDNLEYEMQSYEHIALQYYYLGMMEKSSQYHNRTTRGVDINDRPKGFEKVKTNINQKIPISQKSTEIYRTQPDGSLKTVVQDDKKYEFVNEMRQYAENLIQRLQNDLRQLSFMGQSDQISKILSSYDKLPEPVSLYHQAPKIVKSSESSTPYQNQSEQLPNWDQVSNYQLDNFNTEEDELTDDSTPKDGSYTQRNQQRELMIKAFTLKANLIMQPNVVIQLGESIAYKNPFEMLSPRYSQPQQTSTSRSRHISPSPSGQFSEQASPGLSRVSSLKSIPRTLNRVASQITTSQSPIITTTMIGFSQQESRTALTETPYSMINGQSFTGFSKLPLVNERGEQVVETFKQIRDNSTTKKVVVALTPLKKSQVVDYFQQMRESKQWQRMNGKSKPKEVNDYAEMSVLDMLKHLEVAKSHQEKGKQYLKHLSPLHNPKAAKDNDTRRLNYILRLIQEFRQLIQFEKTRTYLKEEVLSQIANPKQPGKSLTKAIARIIDIKDVPSEYMVQEDQNYISENSSKNMIVMFSKRRTISQRDLENLKQRLSSKKIVFDKSPNVLSTPDLKRNASNFRASMNTNSTSSNQMRPISEEQDSSYGQRVVLQKQKSVSSFTQSTSSRADGSYTSRKLKL